MNLIKNLFIIFLWSNALSGNNQTATLSPVVLNQNLPFSIKIEKTDFELPNGLQSGAAAIYQGKWLFIAGRINGLHGFGSTNNNFPKNKQNYNIYVVDINNQTVESRSLNDPKSGLSKNEISTLAVTAPQYYQKNNTLYISGGYGTDDKGSFSTKPFLTAIDIPGIISWVTKNNNATAKQFIRQITHPVFQVTGGYMNQTGNNPTLLIFGQNFHGAYQDSSNGIYTQQIRKFFIIDDGKNLNVNILPSTTPNPNYRRRDLNVVPTIKKVNKQNVFGYTALAGVFTPGQNAGIWTVPVEITADGKPSMANPDLETTFKQGMNIYKSATLGLFSSLNDEMYTIIFGGITFESFTNGQFVTDSEIPFTNQITTLKVNKNNKYTQYLLNLTYPTIQSKNTHPGNTLLFGTGAYFMKTNNLHNHSNDVFNLDNIGKKETTIGYIVGGIQSTLPNTVTIADSAASPYIFKVSIQACSSNENSVIQALKEKYLS